MNEVQQHQGEPLTMRGRIRVLAFVRYYLPGYRSGGPVQSLAALVQRLSSDFEFAIVTSDRDALAEVPYEDVRVGDWNDVQGARVYYAPPNSITVPHLWRLLESTDYDILYLNSFFHPAFTLLPLLVHRILRRHRGPVVVAPRGEFSPGALGLKRMKKRLYIALSRLLGVYRDVVWHASSELEAADIRAGIAGREARVVVAPNLSSEFEQIPDGRIWRKHPTKLRVIFLSRVSEKKNLHFALEVLHTLRASVELSIVGTIADAAYWSVCQELVRKLPASVSVRYVGAVPHSEVANVLGAHDLFFLPTLGENFGHAILESLAAGTPVLISDQTPWSDIESAGAGWIRRLDDLEGFAEVIRNMAQTTQEDLLKQRERARAYAKQVKTDKRVVEANRLLFSRLVATPKAP